MRQIKQGMMKSAGKTKKEGRNVLYNNTFFFIDRYIMSNNMIKDHSDNEIVVHVLFNEVFNKRKTKTSWASSKIYFITTNRTVHTMSFVTLVVEQWLE